MKHSRCLYLFPCFVVYLVSFSFSALAHTHEDFLQCLSNQFQNSTSINNELIYTPTDPSYFSVLNLTIQYPLFSLPSVPKPLVIITPTNASHVQATVYCAKKHGLEIRTRSGGHDYEGLSYVAYVPFVVIDLINLGAVSVDVDSQTAWVEAGATLGEVYYRIYEKSGNLGFPAGLCHTVGVGGHFSGGGYGTLMRKYGLAADNVIDAQIVDVEGRVLDRESMGEELFWAIRGGGAASFGVVLAWKIRLVPVPSTVTVLNVNRDLEQNETLKLVHRWQYIANKFDEDLLFFVRFQTANISTQQGNKVALQALFSAMYLGGADRLVELIQTSFPELGLVREDCTEMSWIQSILYFGEFPAEETPEALLNRTPRFAQAGLFFKGKSDYVREPISEDVLKGLFERLYEQEVGLPFFMFWPYGAKMSEISESEIPFPHRSGNLYHVLYAHSWREVTESQRQLSWIRSVYSYMAPYVSKHPRAAYLNYRDLDIGRNNINGSTSYAQASIWGSKYYKNNFKRLVHVKTKVDPTNFFRNEQSIPPLPTQRKKRGH